MARSMPPSMPPDQLDFGGMARNAERLLGNEYAPRTAEIQALRNVRKLVGGAAYVTRTRDPIITKTTDQWRKSVSFLRMSHQIDP